MDIGIMQNYINEVELKFGRMSSSLCVNETLCQTYAYAAGFNVLGTLIGTIYVNRQLLTEDIFTIPEINFILAHEYTHIFKNHYVASTLGRALEIFAKGPSNKYYNIMEFLKAVIRPGELLLKIQESEADYGAVEITRDLNSAESCLCKLVSGDLNQPSHTWELYHTYLPAMTMGERLFELKRRYQDKSPSVFTLI